MGRIACLIFVFLFLSFDSSVFACPTPEVSEKLQESIEKIFSTSGTWPGYEPRTLKLAIGYGDLDKVLLFNFANEDLKPGSNHVLSCGIESKWSTIQLSKVPTPTNGVYEPQMPNPNGNELQVLAGRIGAPILFINSTAKIGDVVFTPESISRVAIHEMFHFAYQFSGKFKIDADFERTFLNRCTKNQTWLNQILDEFNHWQDILRDWDKTSNDELKSNVAAILKQRDVHKDDEEIFYCWNATRFWERIEGTAFYVETESAKKANLLTKEQMRIELSKFVDLNSQSVCTGCTDNGHGKINQSYFYGTGALISSALLRLTGTTHFQKDIETGMSPAEVFLANFDKPEKPATQN